jgi:hydrogenase maturation protein HypF
MGRFFDAVSALIGIRQEVSYEGQAAIELEALADPMENGHYPYSIDNGIISLKSIFRSIINDFEHDKTAEVISARFHNTIAQISFSSIKNIIEDKNIDTVVLSGGVWQNSRLLNLTVDVLKEKGISVKLHSKLPPNDGCISFGQSIIAGINYKRKK